MKLKKYVIKNKKFNNYFANKVCENINHFVLDINDAKIFYDKRQANKQLKSFKKIENFEIVGR